MSPILTEKEFELVEALAAAMAPLGMAPIEARIHALILVSPSPLSLDEMTDLLGVSKSSASVAARELERHGAARRFTEPGTKRVRYGSPECAAGLFVTKVAFLGAMGELLCEGAGKPTRDASTRRLHEMGSFYLRIRDALDAALRAG